MAASSWKQWMQVGSSSRSLLFVGEWLYYKHSDCNSKSLKYGKLWAWAKCPWNFKLLLVFQIIADDDLRVFDRKSMTSFDFSPHLASRFLLFLGFSCIFVSIFSFCSPILSPNYLSCWKRSTIYTAECGTKDGGFFSSTGVLRIYQIWQDDWCLGMSTTILLLKTSYCTNLMAKVVLVLYFIAGQSKASWSSKGISPNVPSWESTQIFATFCRDYDGTVYVDDACLASSTISWIKDQ